MSLSPLAESSKHKNMRINILRIILFISQSLFKLLGEIIREIFDNITKSNKTLLEFQ